jgi:hypothetical protein
VCQSESEEVANEKKQNQPSHNEQEGLLRAVRVFD